MAQTPNLGKYPLVTKIGVGFILVGLMAAAYFVLFYGDVSDAIARQKREHQALEGELVNVERSNTEYQKDLAELTERQQRQRDLNKILPETTEYPAFLSAVQGVANVSGVSLQGWSPLDEVVQKFFARVPMKLTLSGHFIKSPSSSTAWASSIGSSTSRTSPWPNPRCRAKRSCSKSTVSRRRSTPLLCRAPRRRPREPSREISLFLIPVVLAWVAGCSSSPTISGADGGAPPPPPPRGPAAVAAPAPSSSVALPKIELHEDDFSRDRAQPRPISLVRQAVLRAKQDAGEVAAPSAARLLRHR